MSTAPTGWQTPKTDWNSNTPITSTDLNRQEGNSAAIETGSRTIDPSQAPSGNTGTLRQLLDWLPNRIKALHGENDWWAAPAATIKAIWAKFHALTGHKHTGNENDAPKLPLSSLDTDVATQVELDTAMSNHLTAQDPHPQYATDTDLAAKVNKAGDTMTGILTFASASAGIGNPTLPNGTDLNTVVVSGFYRLEVSHVNAPVGVDYGQMIVSRGSDTITQIVTGYVNNEWYVRQANGIGGTPTWRPWRRLWHDGNDGAGSGLDADTLDGMQPTSAGGTEANRLAVTNASGRVGDSSKVAGKAAGEIVAAEQLCTLGTVPMGADSAPSARIWTVMGSFAYYIDEAGVFKKIELATGTETTLAALPTGIQPLSLAEAGADKIMLLGRQTASPYHHVAHLYSIAGNSFGSAIDLLSGVTLYASQGQAVAAWDAANYVYVLLFYQTASSTYYCRVVRITLDTLTVTALWTSSSASSPLPVCGIGIIGGKLWVVYDYSGRPNWVNMNLDGTSPQYISQTSAADMRLAWCANPARAMWWGWCSDFAEQGGYGRTKIYDGSKTWCLLFPYITGAYAGLVLYAGDVYILDSPRPYSQTSSPSQWSVFKFKDPLAA